MTQMGQQRAILLAESDAVIGMDLSDALERSGYRVLGPARTTAEALSLLVQRKPDLAFVDGALKDGSFIELAHTLRRLDVPILVQLEAGQDQHLTPDLAGVPWLLKPALSFDVVAALRELMAASVRARAAPVPRLRPAGTAGNPLIRKLSGLTTLSDADRVTLARISAEPRRVTPGTDLVREGDRPDGVFLVMNGVAVRHKLRVSGARQIMAYLVPGDLCDLDVALLSAMDHTITALSACEVVRLAPETVADLLANHPQIARGLRKAQLVDEATLREWLVNVGRRSALERLAHLLCELLLRLRAVGLAPGDSYELPVTQMDLADTAGLTPVHVNRTLGELRRQGLIELRTRRLKILDLPRLRALAEFRPNYLHLGDQAAA
ncbi:MULTISPECIES: helix-turn-helix domain-containing protein [unclassified Methylobacterium]|uniref:helix-turn-helix domain-containing protein n=1 Tax=unclassified Methylobacterium TaxID=2615210 RepID=UPI0011C1D43E|nr:MULTISPECIES: helix-turn-helix domain-containing protein [unclassified Methylobacterium]QEE38193.1 cyclic nucleotide-binding domain-containing protein [Methylobacterium sp. WL1]TXN55153.1 helix-turn-helix domain-containing protein [Methylobacterium sp. WL2]